jgi:predicted lipoprotein with Yx(FWY)xxD motif
MVMKLKTTVAMTLAALAAVGVGYAVVANQADAGDRTQRSLNTPVTTPPGVTLQPLGKAQGYDLGKTTASAIARDQIAYTDTRGLTLYLWDQDPQGKATCADDCAKLFEPFVAVAGAKPMGDWSVITRSDGKSQWALKGKALYMYTKDVDPGSLAGDSPANSGAQRLNRLGVMVGGGNRGSFKGDKAKIDPLPAGWHAALAYPIEGLQLPAGLMVKEVPDAAAFVLVDRHSHTLYAVDPKSRREVEKCNATTCKQWEAVAAPQLATAIGDFSIIERDDGVRQWAYRDHALYSYDGDLAPGYANGIDADRRLTVASVTRYYMPAGVMLQSSPGQGRVLATADGMTLYRRDGYIFQSGGGHSLRRGQPARPAVGRDIGTDPRCGDCEKASWHPFLAAADAQPSGFWNVATRADGRKQWVYQGYALWTYSGDKKPGDINGHDSYDIQLSDDPNRIVDVGTPMDGAAGLWWSIAVP